MIDLYNDILKIFEENTDVLFGIGNIDFSAFRNEYKNALVIAVPHKELLNEKDYREEKFNNILFETRERTNQLLYKITMLLENQGIQYYIPPDGQSTEENLVAPFSFKFAGVNAGIGWIGKNGVLITEKYGPRIRLSAILINYDLPIGNPIAESKCPPNCNICVNNCPYKALTGAGWNMETKREELIDYKLCNQTRSLYLKTNNRKNSCGLCMVACPIGLKIC